ERRKGRDRDGDKGNDRGDRKRDRDKKGKARKGDSKSNMVRLFINVGEKDRVRPGDIVGALAGETKISGREIGVIEIYDKFSYVEIPQHSVDDVIRGMERARIKGRDINIEVAKSK
ncbi:MAG: DbpA RNA binding domain-containing protein, partial [Cytophagaceae bacterium]